MEQLYLKFDDETNLHTCKWEKEGPKKAVIVISHGMAEHILRYEEFGNMLAENGYIVYGASHYAHGLTCGDPDKVGINTKYDFMEAILKDIKIVHDYAKSENEGMPMYLFAHSMGSLAAQEYIEKYPDDFEKVILSGTDIGDFRYRMSIGFTRRLSEKHPVPYYSDKLEKVTLGRFNRIYKNERPENAWLSVNLDNVDAYTKDPYCGKSFPVNYYASLFQSLKRSYTLANQKNIKAKRILLISGEGDPVSNFGKSIKKLNKRYLSIGLDSKYIIVKNARHEMLNEKDPTKQEVYNYILDFYQDKI